MKQQWEKDLQRREKNKTNARRLDKSWATAVLRLREYFEVEKRHGEPMHLERVADRASAALLLNRNLVCSISTDEDLKKFPELGDKETRDRSMTVPMELAEVIRKAVGAMHLQEKVMPTVAGIRKRLISQKATRSTAWNWGRTTLWRCMAKIGCAFGDRKTCYEHARERNDIKAQRSSYIRWVKKYRAEGHKLFYQDETWTFKNMAQAKVWISAQNDFSHAVPSGAGARSIVSHLGSSSEGLLDGALLMHRGSKSNKSADCHAEMNSSAFLDWLQRKVLPRLQELGKRVLVIDRATCRLVLTDDTIPACQKWKKAEIINWIKRHNIELPGDWPSTWEHELTKADI